MASSTRRTVGRVLLAVGSAGLLAATAVGVLAYRYWDSRAVSTVGELSFENPLRSRSWRRADGRAGGASTS